MSFFIAVPTGIKFFNWTGTMFRGQLTFEAPMLFIIGFMVTFLFGGITGVILASAPLDFAVSDTYFLVAHFHYVPFGTVVFTMFGGFYFWWPKFTGKKLNETLGKWHFWTLFISFWMTFLVMHWEGVAGLPRRVANYPYLPGYVTTLNQDLLDRLVHPRRLDTVLPLQRVLDLEVREAGHRGRPVGVRQLPGVGHLLPAAPAQLHPIPQDPVRTARLRPALPAHPLRPPASSEEAPAGRRPAGLQRAPAATRAPPSAPGSRHRRAVRQARRGAAFTALRLR